MLAFTCHGSLSSRNLCSRYPIAGRLARAGAWVHLMQHYRATSDQSFKSATVPAPKKVLQHLVDMKL
jgi:hypothetical protein